MRLRHFHYFIAVAEEGSFVRAARRLKISQPSLSTQIQDLEREIGVVLLDRSPKGVRVTPAGAALLREARATVENAERAIATARAAGQETMAGLRFAYGRGVDMTGAITDLLASFRAGHPDIDVQVVPMDDADQRKALREHRIDVAANYSGSVRVEGFASHVLMDGVIKGVLLPETHPLADRDEISLLELGDSTWFHLPRRAGPESLRYLRAALVERGLVVKHHSSRPTDLRSAAVHLTAAPGSGWILATEAFGRMFTDSGLVYRKFSERPIPFWLLLIWREDDATSVVRDLARLAQEQLRSQGAREGRHDLRVEM